MRHSSGDFAGSMPAVSPRAVALLAGALLVLGSALAGHADDWPQFRGPASNSQVAAEQGPGDWKLDEMIALEGRLPGRGPSSPIVVGGRVIVTASSGADQDRLHVLCFDVADGKPLWHRQFWATGRTITHPQSANAAPTPVSDGRRVFAFFSSNDLAALDLDGNLLWYRGLGFDFPRLGNDAGMASSPLVIGDTVIVQSECQGGAFAAGIDAGDGSTRWQNDRERLASWTSPIAVDMTGIGRIVLVQSTTRLTALDPKDGRELWNYKAPCDGISSVCSEGGLIFLPAVGIMRLRPAPGEGEPEVVWKSNQLQPGAASPIVSRGTLYVINRGGVLIAAEAATGRIVSKTRLEGSFWSTPLVCGDRLLACNFEDGLCQVVQLGGDGLATRSADKIKLGERIQASPALADRAIYLRGDQHLWKLASPAR